MVRFKEFISPYWSHVSQCYCKMDSSIWSNRFTEIT